MDKLQDQLDRLRQRVDTFFGGVDSFSANYIFRKDLWFAKGRKIVGAIFPGSVASDGSAVSLPSGWTSSKTATGRYTINHTLGTANFSVVASPTSNLAYLHDVNSKSSTLFKVETLLGDASGGSFADSTFDFIVMLQ